MRKVFPVFIALVLILVTPTSIAYAEDEEASPDSVRLGRSMGLGEQESRERYDWTVDFNQMVELVSNRYPEIYADARITGEVTGGYILFTTEVPDEARLLVKELPVSIELRTGARYNEKYLLAELMTTYDRMWKTPGTRGVTGEMNADRSGLDFHVTPTREAADAGLPEYLNLVRSYARPAVPTNVKIREKFVPVQPEATIRGGGNLNTSASAGNDPWCTAGFTVRNDAAQHGMSTAGHCAEGQGYLIHYNQGIGGADDAVRLERRAISPHNLDLAWYHRPSLPSTFQPTFYTSYSASGYRTVLGRANPVVGSPLANFGRTNGYHSDAHVTGRDVCAGETPCRRFHITDRAFTAPGDSGGPWFWNNTAYGLHYGKIPNSGGDLRSAFTPVFLLGYMDVEVWVS